MDESMDERLKKEVGRDDLRASRNIGTERRSRDSEDRPVSQNRELTEDERVEMFRMAQFNDVLPDLPNIPGYHVCWLSTTHNNDTIPQRLRLGYVPVSPDEAPDLKFANLKTGDYAGMIGINEMIAFKLPLGLYQRYMQIRHHDEPNHQVEAALSQQDRMRAEAERQGATVEEEEGNADLRRAPLKGVFV